MKLVFFAAPAILCGLACFAALVGNKSSTVPEKTRLTQAVLYAFLPGCFMLAGAIMLMLQQEIRRLRHRVARLEGRKKSSGSLQVVSSEGALTKAGYTPQERNSVGQLRPLAAAPQTDAQQSASSRAHTAAV